MSVNSETSVLRFDDIAAGVVIDVDIKVFDPATSFITVEYGLSRVEAVLGADYALTHAGAPTYLFSITPTVSLINKINALIVADPGEENVIYVKRVLPFTTDFEYTDSFNRIKVADEFDRTVMRDQQLQDQYDVYVRTDEDIAAVIQAAADAVAAAEAALAAMSSIVPSIFPTMTAAFTDYHPAVGPAQILVAFWDDNHVRGSGSLWRKCNPNTMPTHTGRRLLTLADATTQWYEFANDAISPAQRGARMNGNRAGSGTNDDVAFRAAAGVALALGIPMVGVGSIQLALPDTDLRFIRLKLEDLKIYMNHGSFGFILGGSSSRPSFEAAFNEDQDIGPIYRVTGQTDTSIGVYFFGAKMARYSVKYADKIQLYADNDAARLYDCYSIAYSEFHFDYVKTLEITNNTLNTADPVIPSPNYEDFTGVAAAVAESILTLKSLTATNVVVRYGNALLPATYLTDYTVVLAGSPTYLFQVIPTASFIAKIDAMILDDPSEVNKIRVTRTNELDDYVDTYIQWINENVFYLHHAEIILINGTYSHNHNVFYLGTFENGGGVNIQNGGSNIFEWGRWEGGGNVVFAAGTNGNIVTQSWNSNQTNPFQTPFITVTDAGENNIVKRLHALYHERCPIVHINPNTCRTFSDVDAGPNYTTLENVDVQVLGFETFHREQFSLVYDCPKIPVRKGYAIEFYADIARFRPIIRMFNSSGVQITHPAYANAATYLRTVDFVWSNADDNWAVSSNIAVGTVIVAHDDVAFIEFDIWTGNLTKTFPFSYIGLDLVTPGGETPKEAVWAQRNARRQAATASAPVKGLAERMERVLGTAGGTAGWTCTFRLDTTTSALSAPGAVAYALTVATGVQVGDILAVQADNGVVQWAIVDGIGSTPTIDIAGTVTNNTSAGARVVVLRWA